ncbi:MAG: glycoside hydrolase family 30 protein [Bacteroidetes bacterium]|nr:glycoside hydrolase family 30 protein [Bacteroidota bacterium]
MKAFKTKILFYLQGLVVLFFIWLIQSCQATQTFRCTVYETSESGNKLQKITAFSQPKKQLNLRLNEQIQYQTITGFGGSFTAASAHLLNQLSPPNRKKILEAYFGNQGARYSLTRAHINSCDFSLKQYAYAMVEGDLTLEHFSIAEDLQGIIPMIHQAQSISEDGFKIIASPWTAPPWMKDNKSWIGGKLLPQYRDTWALYYAKYLDAYQKQGIHIWGLTVVNEPHGNGNNWESMLFSPAEMTDFVQHYLGPKLAADGKSAVKILGYDQNRAGLPEWVDAMFANEQSSRYFSGTAIHWYESTYDFFPKALQYAHQKAPDKHLIQTEACVDSEVPHWQDDAWYWKKEATDWGWDWAAENEKYLHPKYAPVNRYATDIIGCLNNWVDGWIDWNMVLDRQGGPNWFKNWCVAPVIVDVDKDEVYFTPLYYTMAHFSKFIRPGAVKIDCVIDSSEVMTTAVKNPDNSIVVVIFNPTEQDFGINVLNKNQEKKITIQAKALQTLIIQP